MDVSSSYEDKSANLDQTRPDQTRPDQDLDMDMDLDKTIIHMIEKFYYWPQGMGTGYK